ncbi:MAG: septal ring lytic transglycosylase RlpA family protein [bacterium]|nr:septal ring lytic transglycosylase RlpA family protein [bacterium]
MRAVIAILAAWAAIGGALSSADEYVQGEGMVGTASWYSKRDPGIRQTTANMEVFCDRQLTCAAWGMPFNTLLRVTNLNNGKSVVVRVNDRGPARRHVRKGRIIDLTRGAFGKIADPGEGLIPIEVLPLGNG